MVARVAEAGGWAGLVAAGHGFIFDVVRVVNSAVEIVVIGVNPFAIIAVGAIPLGVVAVVFVTGVVFDVGLIAILFHDGCDLGINLIGGLLDYQRPCSRLDMNGKRTKTEYLLLSGSWTRVALPLGTQGRRDAVDLELNLLLFVVERELDAVLVTIG